LFHDTDLGVVALGVITDAADIGVSHVKANRTELCLLFYRKNGFGKEPVLLFGSAQKVVGKSLGTLEANARQFV
jgi:hypothetical protein